MESLLSNFASPVVLAFTLGIAAKLLKVKNYLLFLSHNPKYYFQWFRHAIGL